MIKADGLTKQFGDFTAASGITFSAPRGEIFGLLGPNGAGKSTTFKMLCGLLRPTAGTGRVAGFDLRRAAPRRATGSATWRRNSRSTVTHGDAEPRLLRRRLRTRGCAQARAHRPDTRFFSVRQLSHDKKYPYTHFAISIVC